MEALVVNLTEFRPEELKMLHQLFSYNRDNLVEDKEEIMSTQDLLPGPHLKDVRYASSAGFSSLIRRIWYVSFLTQQLEIVLSQKAPLDRAIDLSNLPDPQAFHGYLKSELHRNQQGTWYTQRTYKSQVGQRLLDAFSLEYRFLNLLYHYLQ